MKRYRFAMNSGYVGTEQEDVFEFDDDVTEDYVNELWKDWVWEHIDGNYEEVE